MEIIKQTMTPTRLIIEHTRAGYALYCTVGDMNLFVTKSLDVDLILRITKKCFLEGVTYSTTQPEED